jgi:hypothetical protein
MFRWSRWAPAPDSVHAHIDYLATVADALNQLWRPQSTSRLGVGRETRTLIETA